MQFTEIKKCALGRIPAIPQGVVSITKNGTIAVSRATVYKAFGTVPSSMRVLVSDDKRVVRLLPAVNGDGYKVSSGVTCRIHVSRIKEMCPKQARHFCEATNGQIDIRLS